MFLSLFKRNPGRFEACSVFKQITACLLADRPRLAFSIRGFDDFVTSIAAPTVTGWNDSCRAGFHPLEMHSFSRRTKICGCKPA